MIGMYAVYGGSLYNINDQQLNPNGISFQRSNHVEQIFDTGSKLARADVTLANSTGFAKAFTNGEYYAAAVKMIQDQKLTEVEKLASVYRVFLGFSLIDANGVVADEGFLVKSVKPALKYVPLHLNDTNEFLNAFALDFNARFSRHYRVPVPSGIAAMSPAAYRLFITSVSVYQLKADAMILQPSDRSTLIPITDYPSGLETDVHGAQTDKGFRNWNRMVNAARSGMLDQANSPDTDGRMAYTMDPNFVRESVCIFNTAVDNLKFDPIEIKFAPRYVEVNLSITLDGLFIVDSAEDIDQYLKANEDPKPIDPSLPGGKDDTDEPVVNPGNPDGGDSGVIPNPGKPGSGSDTGTKPGESGGEGGGGSNPDTGGSESGPDKDPSGSEGNPGSNPDAGGSGAGSDKDPSGSDKDPGSTPGTGESGSDGKTDPPSSEKGDGSTTETPGGGSSESETKKDPSGSTDESGSTTDPGSGDSDVGTKTDPPTSEKGEDSSKTDPPAGETGSDQTASSTDPKENEGV